MSSPIDVAGISVSYPLWAFGLNSILQESSSDNDNANKMKGGSVDPRLDEADVFFSTKWRFQYGGFYWIESMKNWDEDHKAEVENDMTMLKKNH